MNLEFFLLGGGYSKNMLFKGLNQVYSILHFSSSSVVTSVLFTVGPAVVLLISKGRNCLFFFQISHYSGWSSTPEQGGPLENQTLLTSPWWHHPETPRCPPFIQGLQPPPSHSLLIMMVWRPLFAIFQYFLFYTLHFFICDLFELGNLIFANHWCNEIAFKPL